jgi:hypothetical protein
MGLVHAASSRWCALSRAGGMVSGSYRSARLLAANCARVQHRLRFFFDSFLRLLHAG